MFLYKQVPAERLSGLSGDPRTALATIRMGFRQESGNLLNLS